MKFSKQREMILQQVKNYPIHPTAEQVYTALKKDNPNLSLGTVYRNLNMLSDMGILLKLHIADGSDRFDGRTDNHYHMICTKCERVYDVELNSLDGLADIIYSKDGHRLSRITLNLSGVCRECLSDNDRTTE